MTNTMLTTLSLNCEVTAGHFSVRANCNIPPGITAFFGPSGSGKSLTLSAIAGLLRPHTGTIMSNDTVIADSTNKIHVPTQHRNLGMVFQHAALLPHRNPLDNVALAVHHPDSRLDRRQRRDIAEKWLDRVQAGHLARANTKTLSGGEQQRIALARALASSPRILLLDEPFSALDFSTRDSLRQLVKELVHEHSLTAILVTHDVDDVTTLAHQVVTFELGTTRATFDLTQDPQSTMRTILGLSI
jgi:molybdate transport system ATP-binding protein